MKDNVVFHSGDLSSILEYFPGDLLPSDVGGQGSLGPLVEGGGTMGCHHMLTESAMFVTNALRYDLSTVNVRP